MGGAGRLNDAPGAQRVGQQVGDDLVQGREIGQVGGEIGGVAALLAEEGGGEIGRREG
jgi:hypothetical protein